MPVESKSWHAATPDFKIDNDPVVNASSPSHDERIQSPSPSLQRGKRGNEGMVDLNDVALFVQVVRAGSFTQAARRMGMPPNTASRRIQQLEQALGVRLLHRSTRRLTLTDAGEAFFARSADQVEALSEAALEIAQGGQSPSGKVRVAAAADFFHWFQLEWVKDFLEAHPKVRLEFVLSDARADLVAEGIDLAIRAGKVIEPSVVARRIGSSRASLVASPQYLAARGTPRTLDDLAAHDCIAAPSTAPRTTWQLDGPHGPAEIQVSGRFGANSALTLLKAAVAGIGIALLPDVMTAPHIRNGELVELMPDFEVKGVDVFLVYLSRRQLPRAVGVFIEFALAKMAQGLVAADGDLIPHGAGRIKSARTV
ncbi:MAG TPA: LysR family transcriptional regulator [Burkholderiaceae bacterium]|nr:LysR family transcriptional regulator [Burkholderiaceae bacterium]